MPLDRKSSPKPSKADREREVFALFAAAAHLPVVAGSIQSRPEPEPDILCELEGEGPIAFELVELVDETFAAGVAQMGKARRALRAYAQDLPVKQASVFAERYADAAITVYFGADQSIHRRTQQIPALITWLIETAPAGIEGLDCELPQTLRTGIARLAIQRGAPQRMLDVGFSSQLADPTLEQMRRKLREKVYVSDHPRELLAYTQMHLLPPDEAWLATCAGPVRALMEGSSFRRVSVFAVAQRHEAKAIKWVYPPRTSR